MKPNDNLPDVSKWQPRSNRTNTLSQGLLLTCQAIQSRIVSEAHIEQTFNIDNYDSGPGLEDIVRRELSQLLPDRYSVVAGVVNDRGGRTAGDYDVLIRNSIWSSAIKLGATPDSRRFHFPIESIYSAIEVKQTLGYRQLDEAMEKLVKLSRLTRPPQMYGHITENQHLTFLDKEGLILNPLHTAVLATRLEKGISFRDVALRYGNINGRLARDEVVSELCVLDEGLAWYATEKEGGSYSEATYMWDRDQPLILAVSDSEPNKVFYIFYVHLSGHLTRSITLAQDVPAAYVGRHFPPTTYHPGGSPRYNSGTRQVHATPKQANA